MSLAQDHQVVQALTAQRADQSFCNAILPWRSRSNRPVADPHRPDAGGEGVAVSPIIVTNQVSRCRDPWKRLGDLPRKPLRRRMPGHLEQNTAVGRARNRKANSRSKVTVGTTHNRSIAAMASA